MALCVVFVCILLHLLFVDEETYLIYLDAEVVNILTHSFFISHDAVVLQILQPFAHTQFVFDSAQIWFVHSVQL